jgi:hypothetical protein
MPEANAPAAKTEAPKKAQTEFKVLDVRENDLTLELEDGRVIPATVGENMKLEDFKRGQMVAIKFDGMDRSDAPKDAVVTRVLPKDD